MFSVLPRRFPSSAYIPGGDRVGEMRDRRKCSAREADIQRALGGFNETIKSGIECRVVAIVYSTMIWSCTGDLTGGDDGFRQIAIYVGINASQRELDSRNGGLVAAVEQDLPTSGCGQTGERGLERREIETCELYVELGEPCWICESTGAYPGFDGLCHL